MRRQRESTHTAANAPHNARRIHEESAGKLPEVAACPRCQASYRNGRWTWETAPTGFYALECPACKCIAADDPAGELRLEGKFATAHRDEIEGCLRNVEERERAEHPLKRIMSIRDEDGGVVVRVTDAKLVTQLGHALASAWDGTLVLPRTTADKSSFARASWRRD